jgi:hypothetical protein
LKACGWSSQEPVHRATQRDEEAIRCWREELWPEIKKAVEEGRTLVIVDQSDFYLLPGKVRTYAPVGQTPSSVLP